MDLQGCSWSSHTAFLQRRIAWHLTRTLQANGATDPNKVRVTTIFTAAEDKACVGHQKIGFQRIHAFCVPRCSTPKVRVVKMKAADTKIPCTRAVKHVLEYS